MSMLLYGLGALGLVSLVAKGGKKKTVPGRWVLTVVGQASKDGWDAGDIAEFFAEDVAELLQEGAKAVVVYKPVMLDAHRFRAKFVVDAESKPSTKMVSTFFKNGVGTTLKVESVRPMLVDDDQRLPDDEVWDGVLVRNSVE